MLAIGSSLNFAGVSVGFSRSRGCTRPDRVLRIRQTGACMRPQASSTQSQVPTGANKKGEQGAKEAHLASVVDAVDEAREGAAPGQRKADIGRGSRHLLAMLERTCLGPFRGIYSVFGSSQRQETGSWVTGLIALGDAHHHDKRFTRRGRLRNDPGIGSLIPSWSILDSAVPVQLSAMQSDLAICPAAECRRLPRRRVSCVTWSDLPACRRVRSESLSHGHLWPHVTMPTVALQSMLRQLATDISTCIVWLRAVGVSAGLIGFEIPLVITPCPPLPPGVIT